MGTERGRIFLLVALAALSAACLSSGRKPPSEPPIVAENHVDGQICGVPPRADAECSILEDRLDRRYLHNCPEVKITYGPGEDESNGAAPVLAALAAEMGRIPHLTEVEIVVAAGRGDDVRVLDRRFHRIVAALGALGIAPGRLSRAYEPANNGAGFVTFEAFACDRRVIIPPRSP